MILSHPLYCKFLPTHILLCWADYLDQLFTTMSIYFANTQYILDVSEPIFISCFTYHNISFTIAAHVEIKQV